MLKRLRKQFSRVEFLSIQQDGWRQFHRNLTAMLGTIILLIIVSSIIFGPLIYTTPINKIDFEEAIPPSWSHPFGTNDLGQDILARVLYGGRISIAVGIFRCWLLCLLVH